MEKFNLAGLEVQFREVLANAASARSEELPKGDLYRAARRLARLGDLVTGAKVLWVDDQVINNRYERDLLAQAGAEVHQVTSSQAAWDILDAINFDLVISDIRRPDEPRAGLEFLEALLQKRVGAPMIFYVGHAEWPSPKGAFGIADRPDELVHLVLDVLSRHRG